MKSRKDYEKELRIQTALGTLGKYKVSRPTIGEINNTCDLFLIPGKENEWFISCEVFNVVNGEHAIDTVMEKYNFSENTRNYLNAERMQ